MENLEPGIYIMIRESPYMEGKHNIEALKSFGVGLQPNILYRKNSMKLLHSNSKSLFS